MSYYWAEVKRNKRRKKYTLIGLHDTAMQTKPLSNWGGDTCLPIGEHQYNVLRTFQGDLKEARMCIRLLSNWLTN